MGIEEKNNAMELGLHDVNMEDHHIFKIAMSLKEKSHKYPEEPAGKNIKLKELRAIRVDCDPPEVSEKVVNEFNQWKKDSLFTRESYKAAIKWGLYGAAYGNLFASQTWPRWLSEFHWGFAKSYFSAQDKIFHSFTIGSFSNYVMNPFYVEIATDFLATIKDFNFDDKDDEKIKNPFPMEDEEQYFGKENSDKIVKKVKEIIKEFNENQSPTVITESIKNEINKLVEMIFTTNKNNAFFVAPKLLITKNYWHVWLRPMSWGPEGKKNTEVILQKFEFDAVSVDRALYKSANQIALQQKADDPLVMQWYTDKESD